MYSQSPSLARSACWADNPRSPASVDASQEQGSEQAEVGYSSWLKLKRLKPSQCLQKVSRAELGVSRASGLLMDSDTCHHKINKALVFESQLD